MATQAQSADEIRAALLADLPHWLGEPPELLSAYFDALCTVFERSQQSDQTRHDRTFISLADGDWLAEHGRERNKFRRAGETEASFRARILFVDDKVTRPAILNAVDAVLTLGTSTMVEHPADDPSFVPPAGTTFFSLGIIGRSNSFTSKRAYSILIPDQSPQNRNTAFTANTGTLNTGTFKTRTFTWDANVSGSAPKPGPYTADVQTAIAVDVYRRIMEILDALTAAGVQSRPVVV